MWRRGVEEEWGRRGGEEEERNWRKKLNEKMRGRVDERRGLHRDRIGGGEGRGLGE